MTAHLDVRVTGFAVRSSPTVAVRLQSLRHYAAVVVAVGNMAPVAPRGASAVTLKQMTHCAVILTPLAAVLYAACTIRPVVAQNVAKPVKPVVEILHAVAALSDAMEHAVCRQKVTTLGSRYYEPGMMRPSILINV